MEKCKNDGCINERRDGSAYCGDCNFGPLVSIIISTYNRPKELKRAIESVLKQSYKNWELIVVDDKSPYDWEEVKKTLPEDPRIQYLQLEQNHGKDTKPKNTGILASKGELIGYLDDDNEFATRHIERLVAEMNASGSDIVYCEMDIVDPKGNRAKGISMDFDAQFLLRRNYIDTSMMLHKRDLVFAVGGWDETLPRFVDWNLAVRMMKWGAKFHHVKESLVLYHLSPDNSATKHPVNSWQDPATGMMMFEPTFDPAGCEIFLPYLGDRPEETDPKVAIFTLSYDRLEYTKEIFADMNRTAGYRFDWFVLDQGSKDGSREFLDELMDVAGENGRIKFKHLSEENLGITLGSNTLIDEIQAMGNYQIIIKIDNDCKFMTLDWLDSIVDLWKRNHKLYVSPYVEGLVQNPGGAQRVGYAHVGPYFVEVTQHVGGIFAAIDARAYKEFRWNDQFLHGNQDMEASQAFRKLGYMPMYLPIHRIQHCDGTEGQHQKFPDYFERRKQEKTQTYKRKEV